MINSSPSPFATGNLNLYAPGTAGSVLNLVFQNDGNLVLYRNGVKLWATETVSMGASNMYLKTDGSIAVINSSTTLWTSALTSTSGTWRLQFNSSSDSFYYQSLSTSQILWRSNHWPVGNYPRGWTLMGFDSALTTHYTLTFLSSGALVGTKNGIVSSVFATGGNLWSLVNDGNFVLYSSTTPNPANILFPTNTTSGAIGVYTMRWNSGPARFEYVYSSGVVSRSIAF